MDTLYIVAGLVLLFFGGEALVRGAIAIAARLGLSPMLIGLTVVGFGTSAPELMVSANAALAGQPDIAIGNVVGSNIANILLILGLALVILPIGAYPASLRRDLMVMVAAALVMYALVFLPVIPRLAGLLLSASLVGYVVYAYRAERRLSPTIDTAPTSNEQTVTKLSTLAAVAFVIGGIAGLVFGAQLLVTGATNIARAFGVSEAVIGLTLVAVGTSLPELATAIVAAVKKEVDVVLGNVIGSNIFNVLFIIGLTAIISPIPVADRFAALDAPVMVGVSCALLLLTIGLRQSGRATGLVFLAAYIAYTAMLLTEGTMA